MRLFGELRQAIEAVKMDYRLGMKLDPSVRSKWDVIFFSASFHGLMYYRFSHMFWKKRMKFIAMTIRYMARVFFAMDIHPAAEIEAGIFIDHGMGVVIGETATVGSGTLIYHGVTLGTARVVSGKRHPSIGKNVLIGANASVLGPVKVCDGARIGANSVVIHDVPCACTVVGNPARIVKAGDYSEERNEAV